MARPGSRGRRLVHRAFRAALRAAGEGDQPVGGRAFVVGQFLAAVVGVMRDLVTREADDPVEPVPLGLRDWLPASSGDRSERPTTSQRRQVINAEGALESSAATLNRQPADEYHE